MDFEALKLEAMGHIVKDLGESVLYHYIEGHTRPVRVVFSMADVQVSMGGEVPIDTRQPMIGVRRCDVERKPRQGDMLTRRNVTYEIRGPVREALDAGFKCALLAVDERQAQAVRDRT